MRVLAATALITLWCAACATVEKTPTDARLAEAEQALAEGKKLEEAGQYAEAMTLVERALELRKAVLGGKHPEVANCLNLLGKLHYRRGDNGSAEPLFEHALEIQKAALGENHPDIAVSLNNLASLYYVKGHYSRAEPLYDRALEIRKAAFGENHPDVATSLYNLGILYAAQGHYSRAEPLFVRALEIRKAALGENHHDVATSLTNLANLYTAQGHYSRAEPLFVRALEIQEAALGKNHPDIAASLYSLANLYRIQGHYSRAEPLHVRALEIRKASLGQNHPEVAGALHDLAILYTDQGHYSRAEPLLTHALEIQKAALGENHPHVATSLYSLANLYNYRGHYSHAEPLYARALEIRRAALGENHPYVAYSLSNLAHLYNSQGHSSRAEPLFARALEILKAARGENHPDVAYPLINLASLYKAQGLYARAEPLFARALEVRKAALGENHPLFAFLLNDFANLYADQGLFSHAEPLYARALEIYEVALDESHPYVNRSLSNFGQLRLAQQRFDEAVPFFEQAFASSEQHLRQQVFGFSEKHLADVLSRLRTQEELLYSLAGAHPGDPRVLHLALSAALLRKGRSVREIANTSHIIYRGLEQADRETFEQLRSLRTQLASLSLAGPGSLSPADYQQRLKDLTQQGDTLEEALARRSEPLRRLHRLPSPAQVVSQVAASLPAGSALIEFVSYQDRPSVPQAGPPPAQVESHPRYLALLLFSDGRIRAVDLGRAEPIDRAALRLHHTLAGKSVSYLLAAQALHDIAFRPLLPYLGQAQHLFLVPDGQLNLVPFASLHDGRRFLIDGFHLTYLTSGKDLLPRSDSPPTSHSMVVLADPDFGASSTATASLAQASPAFAERSASLEGFFTTLRSERVDVPWKPLPGTRLEAEAIHRLFPHAKLLLGTDASKQALLSVSTPGLLHIATHGFFLEDTPRSPDVRAPGSISIEEGPQARPADPLLRSGLVLAGAQAPAAAPGPLRLEDSLVTALELAGLNLWGTQLVVLSACDTGRGGIQLGEGVYGLRRAFLAAGAETVVSSLWKVSDQVTKELMEGYYRHLLAGHGRTRALREAMRQLRQQHPHPHFWAAFTALGRDAPLQAPPGVDEEKRPHTAQLP